MGVAVGSYANESFGSKELTYRLVLKICYYCVIPQTENVANLLAQIILDFHIIKFLFPFNGLLLMNCDMMILSIEFHKY